VGGSRDRSPVVSLGIFSVATDETMCPGVDSASKNVDQETYGGEDLTTFIAPKVKKIRSVNFPEPQEQPRPVAGHFCLFNLFYK
jgi:hypothetical protein